MSTGSSPRRRFSQEFLLWVLNLIPLKLRVSGLEKLGDLVYWMDVRHRIIACRNLSLAFPNMDPGERGRIARTVFRNLGRLIAEFSFIPRLTRENFQRYASMEGLEHLESALKKEKGVLLLTAHFGNWEWMAAMFPFLTGRNCHVVMRPLDNRFLDRVIDRLRTGTGNRTIPKQKGMGKILRALNQGGMVGILLDQNMSWQEGVFVKFFGESACTNNGMALIAIKTGAPVLPIFNIRQADGRYLVVIGAELEVIRTGRKDLDAEKNTQLFTEVIERIVREHPDHWLWIHQRWKTRPWQVKQELSLPGPEKPMDRESFPEQRYGKDSAASL